MAKREVLKKELSALSPDELRFLVTRQLRCSRAAGRDKHCSCCTLRRVDAPMHVSIRCAGLPWLTLVSARSSRQAGVGR